MRAVNPGAHICFFGLYPWLNADYLLSSMADVVVAGEDEAALVELIRVLVAGGDWSFYLSSVDPFAAWEHAGYIRVVTGGLQQDASIFQLTEGGIAAGKSAPGG